MADPANVSVDGLQRLWPIPFIEQVNLLARPANRHVEFESLPALVVLDAFGSIVVKHIPHFGDENNLVLCTGVLSKARKPQPRRSNPCDSDKV